MHYCRRAFDRNSSAAMSPPLPPSWPQAVNQAAHPCHAAEPRAEYRVRGKARPAADATTLLTDDTPQGWRLSHVVAERMVRDGIAPAYLAALAEASALDVRELYEFAGIDRTTVGRRQAAGATLPHHAAVKALVVAELLALANQVFGAPPAAAAWLTRPHPLLEGETPLRRARTPWGLEKVQSMLAALRWGGVA